MMREAKEKLRKQKYDSRRVYLGAVWDTWEAMRREYGSSHAGFAEHLLRLHGRCCTERCCAGQGHNEHGIQDISGSYTYRHKQQLTNDVEGRQDSLIENQTCLNHAPNCKGHWCSASEHDYTRRETVTMNLDPEGKVNISLKMRTFDPRCIAVLVNGCHVQGSPFRYAPSEYQSEDDLMVNKVKQEPEEGAWDVNDNSDTISVLSDKPNSICDSQSLPIFKHRGEDVALRAVSKQAIYSSDENEQKDVPLCLTVDEDRQETAETPLFCGAFKQEKDADVTASDTDHTTDEKGESDDSFQKQCEQAIGSDAGPYVYPNFDSDSLEEGEPKKKMQRKSNPDPDFEPGPSRSFDSGSQSEYDSEAGFTSGSHSDDEDNDSAGRLSGESATQASKNKLKSEFKWRVEKLKKKWKNKLKTGQAQKRSRFLKCPKSELCGKLLTGASLEFHILAHEHLQERSEKNETIAITQGTMTEGAAMLKSREIGSPEKTENTDTVTGGEVGDTEPGNHIGTHKNLASEDDTSNEPQAVPDYYTLLWQRFGRYKRKKQSREPFVCAIKGCGARFTTFCAFDSHLVQNHMGLRLFGCSAANCRATFYNKTAQTHHFQSTHTDSTIGTVVCKVCSKEFKNNVCLRRHMITHNDGKRIYVCPVPGCKSDFAVEKYLKQHAKTHRTSYDYLCQICGKSFKRDECLQAHLRSQAHINKAECHPAKVAASKKRKK